VIADAENDPDWIAVDLLSQAEHDESAQSILITDDAAFGQAVVEAVDKRLRTLERRAIAGPSWRDYGAVIVVRDLSEAAALSDRIAPEHLELCVADPEALFAKITHAGAVFLGQWTPEAIGDYVGGPNHVLAHGPLGAVFLGPLGARLHEAHHAGADDARGPARHRPRGGDAGAIRKP
jgi:histidinol dehydrogenase